MKQLYLSLVIFLICFSCSENKKQSVVDSDPDRFHWGSNETQLSTLFESIEYIPLEPHPDGLMRKIDKMMIHDDKYYAFDYFGQNQVYVFDHEGTFLYPIGRKGQGPEEYVGMRNFTIKNNLIYLIDDMTNRIVMYNLDDGSFAGNKRLPFFAHDMAVADNGDYIFAQQRILQEHNFGPDGYNIFITTPDLEIKHRLFPFQEADCGILSQLNYFTLTDDHIVFHTMVADSLVLFDRNSPSDIYATYHFDFGSRTVDRKYENDRDALFRYSFLYGTPFITTHYITGNYWVGEDYGSNPFIYRLEDNKATVENDVYSHFFFYPLLAVEDTIYAFYEHAYFNLWERDNMLPDLPGHIQEHLENGDDVLIKYVMGQGLENINIRK